MNEHSTFDIQHSAFNIAASLRPESRRPNLHRSRTLIATGNPLQVGSSEGFEADWCWALCGFVPCLASVAGPGLDEGRSLASGRRIPTRLPWTRPGPCPTYWKRAAAVSYWPPPRACITKASGSHGARVRPLSASLGLRHLPRAPVRQSREICGLCQVSKHFGTPSHPPLASATYVIPKL
jgi:hypothetical protein